MAKKKNKSTGNGATTNTGLAPVRIRATEAEAERFSRDALKSGAASVGTRVVSPNQVEAFATFREKGRMKAFKTWLKDNRKNCTLIEDAT